MICSYCNAILADDALFCSSCGQAIAAASDRTENTRKFWDDVDSLNASNELERLGAVEKARENAKALKGKFLMAGLVAVVLVFMVFTMNLVGREKLEVVKADAIGKTFSDTNSMVMMNGDAVDRMMVAIKNDHTLTYTYGNYSMYIYTKDGGGYGMHWSENKIYQVADYEYSFRSNLFGKIFLEFNGKRYEVELDDDDGTIFSIEFYAN